VNLPLPDGATAQFFGFSGRQSKKLHPLGIAAGAGLQWMKFFARFLSRKRRFLA
jgi:hypothetical protein